MGRGKFGIPPIDPILDHQEREGHADKDEQNGHAGRLRRDPLEQRPPGVGRIPPEEGD